jgi:tetratricopeptide (TPR) repeat protein
MLIGDLFEKDVTRAIPPVVYFHEQDPEKLQREVEEYIITGGYPAGDLRASDEAIHEQFVRLLHGMASEMAKPSGPENPACWISGFYGSGKSSFAKLLGLALDGRKLPGGKLLSDALLSQDHSRDAPKFRLAWQKLVSGIQPIAVVFDVGSKAREDEQIHAVAVRELQHRLGYCRTSNLVAEYELKLELEKLYPAFLEKVKEEHGKPWTELKDSQLAEDYFSAAIHELQPKLFEHRMSWVDSRTGSRFEGKHSADEAALAIRQMLEQRCPGRTVFIVVDEVSQYVHDDDDRMVKLQSFVMALGQQMRGRGWLLATGQHKLEEGVGVSSSITKLKDRFPPSMRVHLGIANIRDVVHKRLLRKRKLIESDLQEQFRRYRSELALYAYDGDRLSETEFVELYPMLPGHIPLLLDITTGLRSRSTRTQGDAHAIRGLLQLLGDLFRHHGLASYELGRLVTIDMVYDVLSSAIDADMQMTINRALEFAQQREDRLMRRVVKAVAMLVLVQDERKKTSAELIARCLYETLGQGNQQPEVQRALDALVGEGLLGYSEQTGYKIESSAGQQWQRERDGYVPGPEQISSQVQEALGWLFADVERPALEGFSLPWLAFFSDTFGARDVRIKDERKHTVVTVDFQFTKSEGADHWIPRSGSSPYSDRIIWVAGDLDGPRDAARKVVRSHRMLERYASRPTPLPEEQRLLTEERNRYDNAKKELAESVKAAFMAGELYFRERGSTPRELGSSFFTALVALGNRVVSELYPSPAMFSISEKDILYLIENTELAAPPPVLGEERLGILRLDAGRYEVACSGRVPTDVLAYVREYPGVTGSTLLAHFGGPPHGTAPDVLRATLVGLLRGGRIRVELPGVGELTSVRDEGARELLKDSGLRKAKLFENTQETLSPRERNAICALFKEMFGADVARDNDAIADAVISRFAGARERLTEVSERFRRLPKQVKYPDALAQLEKALESCRRSRQVEPAVKNVKRSLSALRDGLTLLRRMETDLHEGAIEVLRQAEDVLLAHVPALMAVAPTEEARAAAAAIQAHLDTERPWEDTADLVPQVELVRDAYRARRRAILDSHATRLDQAIERIKRRDGFERLDPDQHHQVLRHLREGAEADTTDQALAPPLVALESLLEKRLSAGEAKALAHLDTFLEALGDSPTVEVALELGGREIRDENDLERLIDELRKRILHELSAHHRVRLR